MFTYDPKSNVGAMFALTALAYAVFAFDGAAAAEQQGDAGPAIIEPVGEEVVPRKHESVASFCEGVHSARISPCIEPERGSTAGVRRTVSKAVVWTLARVSRSFCRHHASRLMDMCVAGSDQHITAMR